MQPWPQAGVVVMPEAEHNPATGFDPLAVTPTMTRVAERIRSGGDCSQRHAVLPLASRRTLSCRTRTGAGHAFVTRHGIDAETGERWCLWPTSRSATMKNGSDDGRGDPARRVPFATALREDGSPTAQRQAGSLRIRHSTYRPLLPHERAILPAAHGQCEIVLRWARSSGAGASSRAQRQRQLRTVVDAELAIRATEVRLDRLRAEEHPAQPPRGPSHPAGSEARRVLLLRGELIDRARIAAPARGDRGRLQLSRGPLGPRREPRWRRNASSARPRWPRASTRRRARRSRSPKHSCGSGDFERIAPVAHRDRATAHEFRFERRLAREHPAASGGGHRRPREVKPVSARREATRRRASLRFGVRARQGPRRGPARSGRRTDRVAGASSAIRSHLVRCHAAAGQVPHRQLEQTKDMICGDVQDGETGSAGATIPGFGRGGAATRLMAAHRVERRPVEQVQRARRGCRRDCGRRRRHAKGNASRHEPSHLTALPVGTAARRRQAAAAARSASASAPRSPALIVVRLAVRERSGSSQRGNGSVIHGIGDSAIKPVRGLVRCLDDLAVLRCHLPVSRRSRGTAAIGICSGQVLAATGA